MAEFLQDMDVASADIWPERASGVGARDADRLPLVVDLDGTLIKTDLLYESFFDALSRNFRQVFSLALFRSFSKQALKAHLAGLSRIDYASLPFNRKVLELIATEKEKGRKVYLATASNRIHADGVAAALGLFDGVFASDENVNLKAGRKAEALVEAFGEKGFDYVGNDESDRAIWAHSRRAYSVGLSGSLERQVSRVHPDHVVIDKGGFDARALIKALRAHQYAKNGLIFVPLLTAHQFNVADATQALLAFVAFSLCASGLYLLNDLLDIQADRGHPTKRNRPIAAGRLSIGLAVALVPLLTLSAFAIAWFISPLFFLALAVYYVVTNAYSFSLKRRMIVDVVALALLYTIRVFAGAAAVDVVVSEWLFTFSLLIFTALALVKRYVELSTRLDRGLQDPTNRNYKTTDLPVIAALAASAGMNSVMVLALYVSSDDVARMYSRPYVLWGLCPLFLYWIARVVMLAHRRHVDDDPIAFALKDDRSWAIGLLSIALVFAAL
jgi:4-hydroxybenzoate polyprenyltransferase and related prenyltransferases